jgi:catechol-2,3-dioxygenase
MQSESADYHHAVVAESWQQRNARRTSTESNAMAGHLTAQNN